MEKDYFVQHLILIEKRIDEVYDRVADVQSEIKGLKWRVGAISSGVASVLTFLATVMSRYANLF